MWGFVWYVVLFDVITFQANQDGEFLEESFSYDGQQLINTVTP